MLANIPRMLNERRIIFQRFVIEKNIFSAIQNTNTQLSYCRYVSNAFKLTGKENYSISELSKNVLRHSSDHAIEVKKCFRNRHVLFSLQNQITDDEVEILLSLDWTSIPSAEFVSNFEKLSLYIKKLNQRPNINYDNLLQAISALTPNFYDEEIAHVLKCLNLWVENKRQLKDVMEQILKTLDNECFNRFSNLNIESLLMFCNLFCKADYGKASGFTSKALLKTNRKSKSMTLSQLVEFTYLVAVCRNLPVNLYEIEYYLEKNMDSLSVQDIATVSLGFYKNNYKIRSKKFYLHILESMLNNIEIITSQQVSALSKFICYSYKSSYEVDDLLRKILKALEPQVQKFFVHTLTYVCHLAAHCLIYDEKLITSILERCNNDLHHVKLKDIEQIAWSITMFNYDSSYPLYQRIVEELNSPHRQQDIENHRRSFLITLKNLALVNIYPINLLEKVMDPEFMNKTYVSKFAMNDEYYFLDQCIAAEVPNYTGPRLSDDLRNFLAKKYNGLVKDEVRFTILSNEMKDVIKMCERLLNTTSGVYTDKLLPQYQFQDIVICLDERNNPISPEPFLSAMQSGVIKPVPEEAKDYKWLVLIVPKKNMFIKDSNNFTGILASKCRQLKRLGYTPAVVLNHKWYEVLNNENCEKLREDYIMKLLNIEQSVE